jgi:hypothetical protein
MCCKNTRTFKITTLDHKTKEMAETASMLLKLQITFHARISRRFEYVATDWRAYLPSKSIVNALSQL